MFSPQLYDTYLKVYLDDLFKPLFQLWRTVSRGEACECKLRQYRPVFGICL